MTRTDPLAPLAPYYDVIMDSIDYDRWFVTTSLLGDLVSRKPLTHVDLACGTGILMKRLQQHGWHSFGVDASRAMLLEAANGPGHSVSILADMTAIPFRESVDYVTCLFDSLNFLLEFERVEEAFHQVWQSLVKGGIFYFDIVTQRMVKDHFHDQAWSEKTGRFTTHWSSVCDWSTGIVETEIRFKRRKPVVVREKLHDVARVQEALRRVGFELLGVFDAETWKAPRAKTLRLDIVACKPPAKAAARRLDHTTSRLREILATHQGSGA